MFKLVSPSRAKSTLSFPQILLGLLATLTRAAPGYDLHGLGLGPLVPAPQILPAPVFSAPIFKAPVVAPAPIFAPAPIVKTIGVAPATSYATVTKVHIAHPAPIVKVTNKFLNLQRSRELN
jgi:hypothetical protein